MTTQTRCHYPPDSPGDRQFENLRHAVQCNCHISDARHAGNYSLCIYLLKMRELFRWEQGFALTDPLPRTPVGAWLSEREALWDELAEAVYAPLPVYGERHDEGRQLVATRLHGDQHHREHQDCRCVVRDHRGQDHRGHAFGFHGHSSERGSADDHQGQAPDDLHRGQASDEHQDQVQRHQGQDQEHQVQRHQGLYDAASCPCRIATRSLLQ